jgi:hypothetical protein
MFIFMNFQVKVLTNVYFLHFHHETLRNESEYFNLKYTFETQLRATAISKNFPGLYPGTS